MERLKRIIHELNYLKFHNILEIFIFVLALIPSLLYKIYGKATRKKIWLICEDENEARDNGYCFFRYLRKEHPELAVYYAINYRSKDFKKVNQIGKTVRYGGILHWVFYLNCEYNISSQKAGKPDAAIGYVLEHMGIIRNKFIFLQHGITINNAKWLYYENTKMRLFICGAKKEYEYVKENFGYPEENVKYLGFSRFDDYHDIKTNKRQILLIPSWREWIASQNEYSKKYENVSDFTNTEYYLKYQELINDPKLIEFLEKQDCTLIFYPHRNMQKYLSNFTTECEKIKIVSNQNTDIRKLLMDSAVMITDYSSVALDFIYMKKPVIYYQFDEERFREAQYEKGYYDYKNSDFGEVVYQREDIIKALERIYSNNLRLSEEFEKAHKEFFEIFDSKNSERIYYELKNGKE